MTPAEAKLTKYPFPGKVIPAETPGYPDDLAAAGSYHVNFKTGKLAPSPLIQASVRIEMVSFENASSVIALLLVVAVCLLCQCGAVSHVRALCMHAL
jgi:hypothetical protein